MFKVATVIEDRRFLWGVLVSNLIGTAVGVQFYWAQTVTRPIWQWLFVMDCPLATALFSGFVLLVLYKKRRGLVGALAFTSLIKYGFWTLLVFALYPSHYFGSDPAYFSTLALFHMLMMAEAFMVLHFQRFAVRDVFYSLAFLLANDASDYYFGTLPLIPPGQAELIRVVAVISTFLVARLAMNYTTASERVSKRLYRIRL